MNPTPATTTKQTLPVQPPSSDASAERGRVPVSEVWFNNPLPKLSQGAAYIGNGDGWRHFKVLADYAARFMIITLPDKRVLRVPFENIKCFSCTV